MICGLGTADAGLGIGIAWVAGIPLVEDKEDLKKKTFWFDTQIHFMFPERDPLNCKRDFESFYRLNIKYTFHVFGGRFLQLKINKLSACMRVRTHCNQFNWFN